MHISMDVGKCPACSILSLFGNFVVISPWSVCNTVLSLRLHLDPWDPNIPLVSS